MTKKEPCTYSLQEKPDNGVRAVCVNYTYILICSDKTYYCGWTNNLEKRVEIHKSGKGAKYTRSRLPVELVYYETFISKSDAMKREIEIKSMTKKQKEKLINR